MSTETLEFEIVPADSGLELAAKNSIELAFSGLFTEAAKWKDHAATITDPKLARVARLELKNLRVAAEKKRKELKEDSLRQGKAIDGANNIFLAFVVPIEKGLEDIEKEEERKIAAAITALQEEREDALAALQYSPIPNNLGTLEGKQWQEILQTAKDILEVRQKREREAEEARLAEIKRQEEEREAQRLENIRLRDEAAKAEAAAKAEREARKKVEAQARAEAEKAEAARRAAEDAARKEREAIESAAAAERCKAAEAQAKAEAEAKALRDAEAKRLAEADAKAKADAAAAKKAAAAPDKAKLQEFAIGVRNMPVPTVKSSEANTVRDDITAKLESFAKWIEAQAATL